MLELQYRKNDNWDTFTLSLNNLSSVKKDIERNFRYLDKDGTIDIVDVIINENKLASRIIFYVTVFYAIIEKKNL